MTSLRVPPFEKGGLGGIFSDPSKIKLDCNETIQFEKSPPIPPLFSKGGIP